MSDSSELEAILAKLRNDYLAALPAKIETLETTWSAGDFLHLKTEFHKLKGTGKTYGLPEISELSLLMEHLVMLRKEALHEAMPLALELYREIHATRLSGEEPLLDQSAGFNRLKEIARGLEDLA